MGHNARECRSVGANTWKRKGFDSKSILFAATWWKPFTRPDARGTRHAGSVVAYPYPFGPHGVSYATYNPQNMFSGLPEKPFKVHG